MNILPKKRWHVRTKENIARVRRDEAQAAAEEKERLKRAQLAESEARIKTLRKKARQLDDVIIAKSNSIEKTASRKHINFFEDLEEGKIVSNATNIEHEREKKEEREKYEKQIGYLTYLGQDTVEATGKISWYNKVPDRGSSNANVDVTDKKKMLVDPLHDIRHYLGIKKSDTSDIRKRKRDGTSTKNEKPHKKHKTNKRKKHHKQRDKREKYKHQKSSNSESSENESRAEESGNTLEKLRAERLKREQQEHKRAEALLAKLRGDPEPEPQLLPVTHYQRYNSQFNPELARQNKLMNN